MIRMIRSALAVAVIVLMVAGTWCPGPASIAGAQDTEPGARVRQRAAADAAVLLPQRGLGGTTAGGAAPTRKSLDVAIGEPGCEKMTGHIELPDPLPEGRKLPLMLAFHGNGDSCKGRLRSYAGASTDRDPVIVIGVQYQQLKEDGRGQFNAPTLCSGEKILDGARWLLNKVLADYPIDRDRVFVGGFSWGTAWASNMAQAEWANDRDAFPFRAVILSGSPAYGNQAQLPPVPWIFTYGSKETNVAGNDVVGMVRRIANQMMTWGFPVQLHEIPGMGHSMSGRVVSIIRETINLCGGPGLVDDAAAGGGSEAAREPLPFEPNEDPYVKEVVAMCNEDQWVEAVARVDEIERDRSIRGRDKKEIRNFDRNIEKIARVEFPKVEAALQAVADAEEYPAECDIARLKSIAAAFADASWLKGRDNPTEVLDQFGDDYPPLVREREREADMRSAWALETSDRAAAKTAYQALAARAKEDHGSSIWPTAAEYRLQWWVD